MPSCSVLSREGHDQKSTLERPSSDSQGWDWEYRKSHHTVSKVWGVNINKASVTPSRVEAPKTGFAGMWMVQQEELGRVTKPFFKW